LIFSHTAYRVKLDVTGVEKSYSLPLVSVDQYLKVYPERVGLSAGLVIGLPLSIV